MSVRGNTITTGCKFTRFDGQSGEIVEYLPGLTFCWRDDEGNLYDDFGNNRNEFEDCGIKSLAT